MGPHTGISRVPWVADSGCSPEIIFWTWRKGKVPPLRAAIRVKSAGAILSDAAIGPPPLASLPWQVAQYARNNSGPLNESRSCFSCVGSGARFCAVPTTSASAITRAVVILNTGSSPRLPIRSFLDLYAEVSAKYKPTRCNGYHDLPCRYASCGNQPDGGPVPALKEPPCIARDSLLESRHYF